MVGRVKVCGTGPRKNNQGKRLGKKKLAEHVAGKNGRTKKIGENKGGGQVVQRLMGVKGDQVQTGKTNRGGAKVGASEKKKKKRSAVSKKTLVGGETNKRWRPWFVQEVTHSLTRSRKWAK